MNLSKISALSLVSFVLFSSLQVLGYAGDATLNSAYYDRGVYVGGRCGDNVARLAKRLAAEHVDLNGAKVLFLMYEKRMVPPVNAMVRTQIIPARSRSSAESWVFHVVLQTWDPENGPMILDLDYVPRAVPIRTYFSTMFPQMKSLPQYDSGDRLKNLYMRVINLGDYMNDFAELRNGDEVAAKYQQREVDGSPIVSVRQYLTDLENQ